MYTISTGGCCTNHPAPFLMNRPNGIPEYLMLLVRTKAHFIIGKEHFDVLPDQVVLIDKNLPYSYYATDVNYMDDWMHFDCSLEESERISCLLNHPIPVSNAARMVIYFQQMIWEASYGIQGKSLNYNEQSLEHVHLLMTIFINHLLDAQGSLQRGHTYSPYYGKLQELRLKIQSNPADCPELGEISEQLGISASYFQHLYADFFQISFRNDVIDMRLAYAKELLFGTTYTIEAIAKLCGYQNEVHFYRQFRNRVGMTPTRYRQMSLQDGSQ